jgi:hypothetical protein
MDFLRKAFEVLYDHFIVAVIVAVLLIVLAFLRRQVTSLINRVFGGIQVQGEWKTKITRGGGAEEEHEDAELHQLLNRVWGTTKSRPTASGRRIYHVKGWIGGEKLCLLYTQTGGLGYDHGAIILRIDSEGLMMTGYEVGTDLATVTKEISPFRYTWERVRDE